MSIKLKQTQARFLNWHHLGKRKGHTPKQLIEEAVSLLADHPMNHISEALQISISSLKRWKNASENKNANVNFVPLPTLSDKTSFIHDEDNDFHLILPQGMQLSLKGQSIEKAVQLIRALIEGLRTCSI